MIAKVWSMNYIDIMNAIGFPAYCCIAVLVAIMSLLACNKLFIQQQFANKQQTVIITCMCTVLSILAGVGWPYTILLLLFMVPIYFLGINLC